MRAPRGRPFDVLCGDWGEPAPGPDLPFFGTWGDNLGPILASPPGGERYAMPRDAVQGVKMPNPKVRRIAEQEAEVAARRD